MESTFTNKNPGRYQGREFGNYRLLHLLGEGGFSEVYLGEHLLLGTQAAIKVLHTRLTDEEFERFRHEALTIIEMGHPNMVRVLDFGMEDRVPFIVMSYAPNGSLRERYPAGTRLPLPVIVSYVKQIAAALQYAHQQRVIHRDIKPDNLLIGRDDEILLSDFGIAVASHNTYSMQTQEAIGTVAYMAPEQLRRKARPASDQYALGVMVYEWLCGALPFDGAPIEVALQHLTEPAPPLRDKLPTIAPAVEQVVMKALAKDPQQRYPDELAFAEALEQASQAFAVSEAREGGEREMRTVTRVRRKDPPSRARVALLLGLALLVIAGASSVALFAVSRHLSFVTTPGPHSTQTGSQTGALPTVTPASPLPGSANLAMYGFDAQHSQFNPYEKEISVHNVSKLVPTWTTRILGFIGFAPSIVDGVLYITGGGPTLYAVNASTGKIIWQVSLKPYAYSTYIYSPTVVNGVVYVAGDLSRLGAFDARNGKELWTFSSNSVTSSSAEDIPTFVNGVIYFGTHGGSVYALDARTGKTLWNTETGGYTGVAVANGVVYSASDTELFAMDAGTGKILWVGSIGKGQTVEVAPVVGDGIVLVTTDGADVVAFPAGGCGQAICQQRWRAITEQKVWASPAIAYGVVYLSTLYRDFNGGNLYALDAATGRFLWLAWTDSLYAAPVVANGVVYAVNFYGTTYAFNAAGCGCASSTYKTPLWSNSYFVSNDGIDYWITVVNGTVYVGSPQGYINALRVPGTS